MKINKSFTSYSNMGHACFRHEMQILQCYQTIKKGCIKNIKYIILKHYKQDNPSSPNFTSTACNSVQNMCEHNSTISLNSKSNESTTIVSSSTFADVFAITYQYYQFNHFDIPPNQLYFFSICSILFLLVLIA